MSKDNTHSKVRTVLHNLFHKDHRSSSYTPKFTEEESSACAYPPIIADPVETLLFPKPTLAALNNDALKDAIYNGDNNKAYELIAGGADVKQQGLLHIALSRLAEEAEGAPDEDDHYCERESFLEDSHYYDYLNLIRLLNEHHANHSELTDKHLCDDYCIDRDDALGRTPYEFAEKILSSDTFDDVNLYLIKPEEKLSRNTSADEQDEFAAGQVALPKGITRERDGELNINFDLNDKANGDKALRVLPYFIEQANRNQHFSNDSDVSGKKRYYEGYDIDESVPEVPPMPRF